jgi:hypothetical protein
MPHEPSGSAPASGSSTTFRTTRVVLGRHAQRELKLAAARERQHGLQVMTIDQLAARLAGGLSRPIDEESLRSAIEQVLPETDLGELESLKSLPGFVGATVETLRKVWLAGLDLKARASEHPRIASIARIEEGVLAHLPPSLRPPDLVKQALARLDHAPEIFGPVDIIGFTELSPCWRGLLHTLATRVPVRWIAGPRSVPEWLDGHVVQIVRSEPHKPKVITVSAATAHHEAVEALRWARQLVASGRAKPAEIALAAAAHEDYDDHFLALRAESNLDLHFVHGIPITASREGQAAAALADILARGFSQSRMRRLASLLFPYPGPFSHLPEGWARILPADAPLTSPGAWVSLIDRLGAADWPDKVDHGPDLRKIIDLLAQGLSQAASTGEAMLNGRTLAIWRKALLVGPAASLDLTLESLKQDDGLDACVSVAWMPASALAASPRRYVRLLGLNSSRWARGIAEDRLISDHIIPTAELDPLPVSAADRRDFATILVTTEHEVVLSRSRRDHDGRLLGRSTLLQGQPAEVFLSRNRIPEHAFSETDRLAARPQEFRALPQAISADTCWRNWQRPDITPHDGLVRPDHPLIQAVLRRTQSASSLRQLLRNPIGFLWQYGLHWRVPESGEDPLVLNPLGMGDLVHLTLDRSLRTIESSGGLAAATPSEIASAVSQAIAEISQTWETERAVPPRVIWHRALDEARDLSHKALLFQDEPLPGARSSGEVPFGGSKPRSDAAWPWGITVPVEIPGCGFRIAGYIDRLDLAGDGSRALVRDYKTGRSPQKAITLDGGKELQRCLYAFAVKALLGSHVKITASLLYLRDQLDLRLEDPETALQSLSGYLQAARAGFLAGRAVPGIDSGGLTDKLAFALPANASATYCRRKSAAATQQLGAAAHVWEAP